MSSKKDQLRPEYPADLIRSGARGKEFAWNSDNSNNHPRRVGWLQPNAWGLYDMLGNVYEYCRDGWTSNLPRSDLLIDPLIPATGDLIVVRGTSWGTNPMHCRSAFRGSAAKDHRNQRDGFRVVREADGE